MEFVFDFFFEFFIDLIIYNGEEAIENRRFPKPVRFLLIGLYFIFFISVIGLVLFVATLAVRENLVLGMLLFLMAILLVWGFIKKIKKAYLKKKE